MGGGIPKTSESKTQCCSVQYVFLAFSQTKDAKLKTFYPGRLCKFSKISRTVTRRTRPHVHPTLKHFSNADCHCPQLLHLVELDLNGLGICPSSVHLVHVVQHIIIDESNDITMEVVEQSHSERPDSLVATRKPITRSLLFDYVRMRMIKSAAEGSTSHSFAFKPQTPSLTISRLPNDGMISPSRSLGVFSP